MSNEHPDGCFGVNELASILVFGGFMEDAAYTDPEGYDGGRLMEKVGYLCELLNKRVAERAKR